MFGIVHLLVLFKRNYYEGHGFNPE